MAVTAQTTLSLLLQLKDYDSLIALFTDLGFAYAGESRSTAGWPASLRDAVRDWKVPARHGQFFVHYVQVPDERMPSWERQVVTRVLKAEPHGLFVFTNPSHSLWHFVHVRYDEQAERRRQLRRFVVDRSDPREGERLRTTAERLSKLAIAPGEQLNAVQLQERCDDAFRISEISRAFLKKFVGVVTGLTKALADANPKLLETQAEALHQAQLLMDRLVFLYFVQKKDWLNAEKDYLYTRFQQRWRDSHTNDTFYREHLLPLFRALSHRDAPRPAADNGKPEAIPFLNGGLFDLPLAHGTANPPTDERIRVPNEALYPVFEDFLEAYNFTVTEDTPLDVEVAVNPEVIGTIFETFVLTADNEPDTNAPDRRKATGSYYTPRVVVHFICRAVLRRYLAEQTGVDEQAVKKLFESDPPEQLDDAKVTELRGLLSEADARHLRAAVLKLRACDPAVGSGAFLVGLFQEMVKLVSLLDVRLEGQDAIRRRNYAYALKKRIIESCLYGVDIQDQAIRICELRLWLSLVVDYQVDTALPLHERMRQVEPLPNLTFRVRMGDSLLDQLFGTGWDVSASRHEDLMGRIRDLKRTYFGFESPEGKRELERQVLDLQLQLLERILNAQRQEIGATLPMAGLSSAKQTKEVKQIKERLAAIDALLAKCRSKRGELGQTRKGDEERRFDTLRKDLGVSFAWALDFAEVFDPKPGNGEQRQPGFDVIVGNPPFPTARNPAMRERYRDRWHTSCYKKYHLLAPFVEVALVKLLRPQGQLGYIVSNAFATRDFGRPLVEQVFSRVELLNVIDCSGLMFPGHGTPTCILLGHAIPGKTLGKDVRGFTEGKPALPTILCGTRPGMGQLHEEAEETALWREIETGWETDGFTGHRMATVTWDTGKTRTHPYSFDAAGTSAKDLIEDTPGRLRDVLQDDVGFTTITASDDVFNHPPHVFRRASIPQDSLRWFVEGDQIRDWTVVPTTTVLVPYSSRWELIPLDKLPRRTRQYLSQVRIPLEQRKDFGSVTYKQRGKAWWGWHQLSDLKYTSRPWLGCGEIATHMHAVEPHTGYALKQTVQVVSLDGRRLKPARLSALLNSSSALFWLKQVSFCKRSSDNPETDDYYVFAGGKIQRLPVPQPLLERTALAQRGERFAERCSALGAEVPGLHPRKLFERPGDAYTDWYAQVRGYQQPHPKLKLDWASAGELKAGWSAALVEMRRLRREMVALQEEMDWLVYGAYGLLPEDDPAVNLQGADGPMPIEQLERPYRLIQHERPVPAQWEEGRKALWRARLQAIASIAHVGQIEQPAYKRRWDEPFDDKDFLHAYEWWLREKAEWLMEHQHGGGPVLLDAWASELRQDPRVRAAWGAALEIGAALGNPAYAKDKERGDFAAHLKRIIEEEAVPDDRATFKKKHEKLRGIDVDRHLPNGVPRERFRSVTGRPGAYIWAGKDLWGGVKGDVWDA